MRCSLIPKVKGWVLPLIKVSYRIKSVIICSFVGGIQLECEGTVVTGDLVIAEISADATHEVSKHHIEYIIFSNCSISPFESLLMRENLYSAAMRVLHCTLSHSLYFLHLLYLFEV